MKNETDTKLHNFRLGFAEEKDVPLIMQFVFVSK